MSLRISVALCTYNGERYLQRQLDSITAQTRPPQEVIVCDDDSTDSTRNILASFAASAPFSVRIERNASRLGSTANFDKAIQLCGGDLIALSDQDDIWSPERLSIQADRFECDPLLGGLFSDACLINSESVSTGRTLWQSIDFTPEFQRRLHAGQAASVLLCRSVVTGATLMFRADLVPKIHPIPSSWVHDGWIAWLVVRYSKIDFTPQPLVYYRLHSDQQCGVLPTQWQRLQKEQQNASAEYLAVARQLQDLRCYLDERADSIRLSWELSIPRKIQHLQLRAGLPANRFSRLVRLLPELQNYRRYSKGWKSMLKDILI